MAIPIGLYQVSHLRAFIADAFQELCHQLLLYEVVLRYPASRLLGPGPQFVKDGGVDFLIERRANRGDKTSAQFCSSLTADLPGDIAVSCKTGAGVKAAVLRDAGKGKSKNIQKYLRDGGSYLVLTNSLGPLDVVCLQKQLVSKFADHLQVGEDSLKDRVDVRAAGDIVNFLNTQPVNLSTAMWREMGLLELTELSAMQEWEQELQQLRSMPSFVSDANRDSIISAIRKEASSGARKAVWLHGAPGVGKSRVVLEALRALPTDKNVFVTSDVNYGEQIARHSLSRLPGITLIIDECPTERAIGLQSSFIASGNSEPGLLILIGPNPAPHEIGGFGNRFDLKPLDLNGSTTLVAQTLGLPESEEIVQRIVDLTEGFPWFAVLVANAVSSDHQTLMVDRTQLNAADLAIGGPLAGLPASGYSSKEERDSVVSLRKKALIASILLEGEDWNKLHEKEQQIARILESSWPEIREAAQKCEERGILRTRLGWRYCYVTPSNLGRIVAESMLQPLSGLAVRIKREAPDLLAPFHRRLERLEVSHDSLTRLAESELVSPFDVIESAHQGTLSFLAEQQPHAIGHHIASRIASLDDGNLKSLRFVRRSIVDALSHISRRKGGFLIAEPSLFRLAMNETEAIANNATGIWSSLFAPTYACTHEPFPNRLHCLETRLQNSAASGVLLALDALKIAVGSRNIGQGYSDKDLLDGDWPRPTYDEIRKNCLAAWMVLLPLTRLEGDVGAKARQIAVSQMRSIIHWNAGPQALAEMANVATAWPPDGKVGAREKINDILRYDQKILQAQSGLRESIDSLSRVVAPSNYHDKLVDIVGSWTPGSADVVGIGEESEQYYRSLEAPLIREMLEHSALLREEIGWLESEAAVRSNSYMFHLGNTDEQRAMLPVIRAALDAGNGYKLLPSYLAGVAYEQGSAVVDDILRGWRGIDSLATATLQIVQRLGASIERIHWLVKDLSRGAVTPDALYVLAFGGWGNDVSLEELRPLISEMMRCNASTTDLVAFAMITHTRKDPLPDAWIEIACDLSERSARHFPLGQIWETIWMTGCQRLILYDRTKQVANAAWIALNSSDQPWGISGSDCALSVLVEVMRQAPSDGLGIIDQMLDQSSSDVSILMFLDNNFEKLWREVPYDLLTEWIGNDERKGSLAAQMVASKPDIVPLLLSRFGAESRVAQSLTTATLSGSFSGNASMFHKSRMAKAEEWAQHADPEVSRWANTLISRLKAYVEMDEAREEFENREWGR